MIDLLEQYIEARKELKKMLKKLGNSERDNEDKTQINSMIDDMTLAIDWMKTGCNPFGKGADINKIYHIYYYEDMDILPDIYKELRKERDTLHIPEKQQKQLTKIFNELSDRERQCYVLFKAEKMSMQQIALQLDISKASVQTYIKRAKEKIEKIIRE